jgi:hypothetical protein
VNEVLLLLRVAESEAAAVEKKAARERLSWLLARFAYLECMHGTENAAACGCNTMQAQCIRPLAV